MSPIVLARHANDGSLKTGREWLTHIALPTC